MRASRQAPLAMVRAACLRPEKRRWRGLGDRWRGVRVEQAYRNLHAAKVFLVGELGDAEINTVIPEVSARMAVVLDRGDPRRTELEKALLSTDVASRRIALRRAMETAYDASDEGYARLRDFRNILLLTSLVLALAVGIIAIAVSLAPHSMPLCFRPAGSGAVAGPQQGPLACPSGEQQLGPASTDVLIIAGLGALGGGLAALFSIRNLRGTSTPYSLPAALAVLKVPSGALTALAGLLLLGGGFAPGFSNLDSQRQILAYALVFGYLQQLITRLVDGRAQSILNKLPSKDPEATQAQGTATRTHSVQRPAPQGGAAAVPEPPIMPESTTTPNQPAASPAPDGYADRIDGASIGVPGTGTNRAARSDIG